MSGSPQPCHHEGDHEEKADNATLRTTHTDFCGPHKEVPDLHPDNKPGSITTDIGIDFDIEIDINVDVDILIDFNVDVGIDFDKQQKTQGEE